MLDFQKSNSNGFNYTFERCVNPGEVLIVRMPGISANKRGINDIGWQTDGDPTGEHPENDAVLYGTLSAHPEREGAIWQEFIDKNDVNKTISAIKIVGGQAPCNVFIRAILY